MKFNSVLALAVLSAMSASAFADTQCTVVGRNTALSKHKRTTEKSGLSLSECVALAEKVFGQKGAFNVNAGLFDIDHVRYTFTDENSRTESTRVVEGEITSHEASEVESAQSESIYKPRRDRCGGEE